MPQPIVSAGARATPVGRARPPRPAPLLALLASLISLVLAGGVGARAAEAPARATLELELNRLTEHDGGCRMAFVLRNRGDLEFRSINLELVLFDTDGVIDRRLTFEFAPVRPGKTVVRAFDIPGLACGGLGRVLVNEVVACETPDGPVGGCLEGLEVRSRTPAELTL